MAGDRADRDDCVSMSRRVWARVAIWGAVGLSFLRSRRRTALAQPGTVTCYLAGPRREGAEADQAYVERWSRLGHLWREISAHKRRDPSAPEAGPEEFDRLHSEVIDALNDASAWPEVCALFEERWHHLNRLLHGPVPDHTPPPGGIPAARAEVERQVEILEDLSIRGKLGSRAVRKAARALAIQAEFFVRLRAREGAESRDDRGEATRQVVERYESGRLRPGRPAVLAGRRVAELTPGRRELPTESAGD